MIPCSAPGHSFPGSLSKDKNGVYVFGGGNTNEPYYLGAGKAGAVGSDLNKLRSTCWAVNHGLGGLMDAQLAWTLEQSLPAEMRARHGTALLGSAIAINLLDCGLFGSGSLSSIFISLALLSRLGSWQ